LNARILALVGVAALAGCATPTKAGREDTSCGSLSPPFHAPLLCSSGDKAARTLRISDEAVDGVRIEREAGNQGGLRVPPQIVIPFVRPARRSRE
jgi:hypothetical protein